MKNLLLLSFLAIGFTANAQLFVKPTVSGNASYVYVNDTFLFVEQDVELETNRNTSSADDKMTPNILLRGEAQLLQGEGTDKNNKGTGEISIYQEGTVNNFDYNLWASPVGAARQEGTGTTGAARGNGNSVFTFQHSDTDNVIFLPLSVKRSNQPLLNESYDGTVAPNALRIAHYWLFSYNASSGGYAEWDPIGNTGSLGAGYGFTMKGVSGTDTTVITGETGTNNAGSNQRYDFRGRANSGDIANVTVGPGEDVLVGNPYPSAMDLSYFLLENSAATSAGNTENFDAGPDNTTVSVDRKRIITGAAYFWDSKPGVDSHYLEEYEAGYGTFSPMGNPLTDGMYVPATYQNFNEVGVGLGNDAGEGDAYARRFSPVGQGFFLEGIDSDQTSGGQITFSNRHRVFVQENTSTSQFRSSQSKRNNETIAAIGVQTYYPDVNNMETLSQLYLAVGINDQYTRQLAIGLTDLATEDFDFGIDAPINGPLATDVAFASDYSNNIDKLGLVITGVPKDEYQWIPLKIQAATTSEFKFKIHRTEEFEYSNVLLLDSLTSTYYDILNDEALLQLEEGTYTDRFYVRFTEETSAPIEEETVEEETMEEISVTEQDPFVDQTILDSFTIYQNNAAGQLEIYNPENIIVKDVALFDLSGKQIFKSLNLGNETKFTFPTNNLAIGIYVVKFVTRDGLTKGQKVSITN